MLGDGNWLEEEKVEVESVVNSILIHCWQDREM